MTKRNKMTNREPSVYEDTYPNLWQFFDGAFQTNSGGHAQERDFNRFTLGELMAAEEELAFVASMGVSMRTLGALADTGYTLMTQCEGEDDKADGSERPLKAFKLLDTMY